MRAISYIHTLDLARCRSFYETLLGLDVTAADDDVVQGELGGTLVRLIMVNKHVKSEHSVFGLEVPDIAAFLTGLKAKGVIAERFSRDVQDALGVYASPDGEKVAWIYDPDGNTISVIEAR